MSTSVGFIGLFGVAVLNGVVMVSYFNELRREGMNLEIGRDQRFCAAIAASAHHCWCRCFRANSDAFRDWTRQRNSKAARCSRYRRPDQLDLPDPFYLTDSLQCFRAQVASDRASFAESAVNDQTFTT